MIWRGMIWKIATAGLAMTLAACTTSGVSGSGTSVQAFTESARPSNRPLSAAIVEAMAGGLIGGPIGAGLDQRDRRRALEAEYHALEYMPAGQTVVWGKAGSRGYGEVVAGSPYRVGSQDCRQYAHTVHAGGQPQTARGAACRNSDGSWTLLA